jgi:polysaccharide export outer membrane protein
LAGGRTLVEMMSSIGGLLPTASRRIKVTRRKEYGAIPLPNAVALPDGSGSSVEINMAALQNNLNPADDIVLQPFDVISVERAQMVYVMGEVGHVGGFALEERDSMSVIQALALAGGLSSSANPKSALILRPVMDTSRRAGIPINLPRILKGEEADKPLFPNDVLVIGKNSKISARDLLIILPLVTTVVSLTVALTR